MFSLSMYVFILALLFAGPTLNAAILDSLAVDNLKNESLIIDRSLSLWFQSHGQTYCSDLSTLQNMGILPNNISLSPFYYAVTPDFTQYRLTVYLPNGSIFVSPNSKY